MLKPGTLNFDPGRSYLFRALRGLFGLFPLTLQGCLTLVVAALALSVFGYGAMDLVVFSLAICALAILVFCLFCAVVFGVVIQRKVQHIHTEHLGDADAIKLECGYFNESGFTLPALAYFPLIRLSWQVSFPDRIQTRIQADHNDRLVEELLPQRRCLTDHVVRQFTVADVLGFCRFSWRQKQPLRCMALPRTNSVKALPLLRSMTAEDGMPHPSGAPEGDRMEIRRYAPGDSVRDIMWKSYARNRQLNVRLAERSVFHSKRTVGYLLSSEHDEAAAAVARLALEKGALGEDWAFSADGTDAVCTTLPEALQAVARSRAIAGQHAYGLDRFLERCAVSGGVHCIVFAAAEPAAWQASLQQTIQRFPGQFSLILATDGFSETMITPWWQRLLLNDRANPGSETDSGIKKPELLGLLTELGQLVESTLIVDRNTGHSFDRQLRKV